MNDVLNHRPSLHDQISEQREKVHAAEQAWRHADNTHEEAAWLLFQSESGKLDALYKYAKANVLNNLPIVELEGLN